MNRIGGGFRSFNSFDRYRTFLASSAIFFNPSFAAPNLAAMVEAQLCGLAIVTTDAHGEASYIENGVNGFASNDIDTLIDFVDYLRQNPLEIEHIGDAGRAVAQRLFNIERFSADWDRILIEAPGCRIRERGRPAYERPAAMAGRGAEMALSRRFSWRAARSATSP